MGNLKRIVTVAFLSLFIISSAEAQSSSMHIRSLPLSVNDLAADAAMIFKGKVLSTKEYKDETINLNVREINFKVQDGIRGVDGNTVTLKEWASFLTPFSNGDIKNGKSYVFFFNKISKLGLTTLLGVEQGYVELDGNKAIFHTHKESLSDLKLIKLATLDSPQTYSSLKSLCLKEGN